MNKKNLRRENEKQDFSNIIIIDLVQFSNVRYEFWDRNRFFRGLSRKR